MARKAFVGQIDELTKALAEKLTEPNFECFIELMPIECLNEWPNQ